MGYAFCLGSCGACGKMISFNPVRVPSMRDKNGSKQPICRDCVKKWQALHPEHQFVVANDAYEAVSEEEL